MGSKLSLILSLFFSVFVFIFAIDLITLQANYSNLESIGNSISLIISSKGSSSLKLINEYEDKYPGIVVILEDEIFKVGEFKTFQIVKDYQSIMIFQNPIQLKIERTVIVGQYEGTFE